LGSKTAHQSINQLHVFSSKRGHLQADSHSQTTSGDISFAEMRQQAALLGLPLAATLSDKCVLRYAKEQTYAKLNWGGSYHLKW
jgi:hypothetical protein